MSLLTRCPACTTIYRVVPDQLRISQGWVKCGQCGDIFDATQHLVQVEQVSPTATQPLSVDETPPDLALPSDNSTQSSVHPGLNVVVDAPADTILETKADGQTEVQAQVETPSQAETLSLESASSMGVSPSFEDVFANNASPIRVPLRASGIDPDSGADPQPALAPVAHEADTKLGEISFLRDARRADRWQRPWVRAVLLVLATLLMGLLFAQVVYQQRHVLVARWPEVQPALKLACEAIGCELQPVQRIESVLIDSATFNQLGDGLFLLSCVLKNTAELPLAVPSIELTLTDLPDRTVVRRVFSAGELDAGVKILLPLAEWRASAPLALTLPVDSSPVVGYRIRVFYP